MAAQSKGKPDYYVRHKHTALVYLPHCPQPSKSPKENGLVQFL